MIRVLTCLVSGERSSWLYVGIFSLCLHVALPWGVVGKAESGPHSFFKIFYLFIYLFACIGLLVVAWSIFSCGI